ncbi:YqeG family HAD IIIA-type phosphatase [Ruminococcus sp.]|nr:YqeG family HAD IIIA-type phosphatase [Ruminococcus sp.]MCI5815951.1 YqeG family HAD IIIA-type phosphatase [Ruminococcus sp.]MDD7555874.1 YqeG family HAD IIIA-type phosphatase [Ruminococcus sp.]MDY4964538.1 YqeG family HAD IIIA-type phosphatase [Ruminococcus callidus]
MFHATVALRSVLQIQPGLLRQYGIRGLMLDLDNTLTTHDNPVPAEGVLSWIDVMRQAGIALMIVSNNKPHRVQPFAAALGLPFVAEGAKPLPKGFRQAQKRMQLPFSQLAVVGDQIFTDILGANLCGVKSIYVRPIQYEKKGFLKVKRWLERPFLPKV